MIQANKLRIGNLVETEFKEGNIKKIVEIRHKMVSVKYIRTDTNEPHQSMVDYERLTPIVLTPEFFENNGYKRGEIKKQFGNGYDWQPKDVFTEWFDFKINDNVIYRFSKWHSSGKSDNCDCLIWHDNEIRSCEFVNDFQNLFYALEGSEFVFSSTEP